jgi:hypothetical protein
VTAVIKMSETACSSLLQRILAENGTTEIGKDWKFSEIASVDEYRSKIPLTTYKDYKPYIDRIAEKGEQNLLCNKTVIRFAPTSGTTGAMKLIPIYDEVDLTAVVARLKGLSFLQFGSIPTTPSSATSSGLPILAFSVAPFKAMASLKGCVVPIEAYHLPSLSIALYAQLVFALKVKTVHLVIASFIPIIVRAMTELKAKWSQMVTDIRLGRIDPSLPIPDDQRDTLNEKLGGPDPERADQLQAVFEEAQALDFKDIMIKLWPDIKSVLCGCSGNQSCFVPTVQGYCGPSVRISSAIYNCSESTLGLPAKPGVVTSLFRLLPNIFYEFIPLDDINENNPCTLLPNEVEEGKIYEIVITTFNGWYCYRNGDLIKVIETTNEGPLIDFYGRGKMTLFLSEHRLYEADVEAVMSEYTSTTLGRVEYIVSTNVDKYKMWIECDGDMRKDLNTFIDEKLQNIDFTYKYDRNSKKIEELEIVRLKNGTFLKILDFMKSKTLNAEMQLKIPRMVLQQEIEDILQANVAC